MVKFLLVLGFFALLLVPFYLLYRLMRSMLLGLRKKALEAKAVVENGRRVQATVVGTQRGESADLVSASRFIRYAYTAHDGQSYEGEMRDYGLDIGDTLEVVYAADHPEQSLPAAAYDEAQRTKPAGR